MWLENQIRRKLWLKTQKLSKIWPKRQKRDKIERHFDSGEKKIVQNFKPRDRNWENSVWVIRVMQKCAQASSSFFPTIPYDLHSCHRLACHLLVNVCKHSQAKFTLNLTDKYTCTNKLPALSPFTIVYDGNNSAKTPRWQTVSGLNVFYHVLPCQNFAKNRHSPTSTLKPK